MSRPPIATLPLNNSFKSQIEFESMTARPLLSNSNETVSRRQVIIENISYQQPSVIQYRANKASPTARDHKRETVYQQENIKPLHEISRKNFTHVLSSGYGPNWQAPAPPPLQNKKSSLTANPKISRNFY